MSCDRTTDIDDKHVKRIEDSAKLVGGLSAAFLGACLYTGIAVASTSHQMLLVGGNLELPLLRVGIPLRGFYFVAPALIVILHIHLLLQEHFLVRRLEPSGVRPGEAAVKLYPALPVLRFGGVRERKVDFLLDCMLFAIHAALPILLLGFVQAQFLPYHSLCMTLWHQALMVVEVIAIWYFLAKHPRAFEKQRRLRQAGRAILAVAVFYFTFGLAVVPGTWFENICRDGLPLQFLSRNIELPDAMVIAQSPAPELISQYISLLARQDPQGHSIDRQGTDEAFRWHSVGVSLAGRNLRGANLARAKLFNADLRDADLEGASLVGADLRGAKLTRAKMNRSDLRHARLTGVDLSWAEAHGADFGEADLQGAAAVGARLDQADLGGARLRGAEFRGACLSGADLSDVAAVGASFALAHLEGAQFIGAGLAAVDFNDANLDGADFREANLHGATNVALKLVDLRKAHFGGACVGKGPLYADLRNIDFVQLTQAEWLQKRMLIEEAKKEAPARIAAAVARLPLEKPPMSEVEQAACVARGAFRARSWRLGLLYRDAERVGAMKELPPVSEQSIDRRGTWNEATFHRYWATMVVAKACVASAGSGQCSWNDGLAWTLVQRAIGEYQPGDQSLDGALAAEILQLLRRGTLCGEIEVHTAGLEQSMATVDLRRTQVLPSP